MILLSANNANTTLATGISSSTTTLVLASGTGALFPSPGTNQYFPVTLNDALTGLVYEICWCTSRAGDNLTVLRGQEGTTARAWLLGDYAYNANTAGNIQTGRAFSATNNPTLPFTIPASHNGVSQICSSTGTITLPATLGISDGFLTSIICGSSGPTITINPNSSNVILPSGSTSSNFTITGAGSSLVLQWNASSSAWYPPTASFSTAQVSPKRASSAQGISISANYSATLSVSFTIPPGNGGWVMARAKINLNTTSASGINTSLVINGQGGNASSSDSTLLSQSHGAFLAVSAGASVTTTYSVTATSVSPNVSATYDVEMFFLPNP